MLCSLQYSKFQLTSCQCVAQHFLKNCILPCLQLWNAVCHLLPVARLCSHGWLAVLSIISVIRKIWHIGPYGNILVVSSKQTKKGKTTCSDRCHSMWTNSLQLLCHLWLLKTRKATKFDLVNNWYYTRYNILPRAEDAWAISPSFAIFIRFDKEHVFARG